MTTSTDTRPSRPGGTAQRCLRLACAPRSGRQHLRPVAPPRAGVAVVGTRPGSPRGVRSTGALLQPAGLPALSLEGQGPHHAAQLRRFAALAARHRLARAPGACARTARWMPCSSSGMRRTTTGRSPSRRCSTSTTPQRCGVQMTVTNTDSVAQPMGLGWHPYFPRRQRSRLQYRDRRALGQRCRSFAHPQGGSSPASTATSCTWVSTICFEGWRGAARIRDEVLAAADLV